MFAGIGFGGRAVVATGAAGAAGPAQINKQATGRKARRGALPGRLHGPACMHAQAGTHNAPSAVGKANDDTGVKFVAWGSSADRLYTGSSDGVVKVWNIRSWGAPLVQDLIECPAPVSFGAFSPDFSKLVVGDASGRVFLLSTDDNEDSALAAALFTKVQLPDRTSRMVRRPKPFASHAEPPPPPYDTAGQPIPVANKTGVSRAYAYLVSRQLRLSGDPTVGAVQGPAYADSGLFRRGAYFNKDGAMPLLAAFEAL